MRHGTSSLARTLVAVGLAVTIAPVAATASFAGARQEGPVKVLGTITNKFEPADIKAAPNAKGEISIEFTSEGAHTIESKDVPGFDSGNVNDGETKTVTFKAPAAGQYRVICLYHESVGMVGTLTVTGGTDTEPSESAAPSSAPPASASASASVGAPDDNAPTAAPEHGAEEGEAGHGEIPGVEGNETLERIEAERAAQAGAVSGFKFFTFVCVAFLFILGAAVLFSTRPRRAGR